MINLNTLQNVSVVGPLSSLRGLGFTARMLEDRSVGISKVSRISTDDITVTSTDRPPFDDLRPVVTQMEGQFNIDPETLFVVDSSNKASVELARLLQGPWRGFPWSAQTIVI